ncbi:MAG TPA: hypothetical protein VE567_06075, partial [Sphingomonas sp.]|nr:hypothetical protein [Sphingomonas sp.]
APPIRYMPRPVYRRVARNVPQQIYRPVPRYIPQPDYRQVTRYQPQPIYRPVARYIPQPIYRPVIRYQPQPIYRPMIRYAAPTVARYAPIYQPAYDPTSRWSEGDWWNQADWSDPWAASSAPLAYGYAPQDYYPSRYSYVPSDSGYWPADYGPRYDAGYDQGPLGGGDGLLSTLLPALLQSVMGGNFGLDGLGGLTTLGSGFNVLPLQEASIAPYAPSNTDLTAALLPSLFGSGNLF